MERHLIRRVGLLLAIGASAFFGWLAWKAYSKPGLPTGIVSGNGRIESIQVDVTAKYPGRLVQLLVREGDLVRPGQILAKIDTLEIEAQLARAKAQVAEAQQSVAQARASIIESESNARLAEQNFRRGQSLFEKRVISREEYDGLKSKLESTKATVEAQKAREGVARHTIEEALAEVNRFEVQIADSTLKSPVLGRVLYKLAEIGEVLPSGGKALTLINLGDIYMEIYLPSREAARVQIGADSRIVLDVAPEYAARTKVSFVSPESQFTPKQVETASERDKLMFRVKLQIPEEAVLPYIDRIKTGVRGVGYVRLDDTVEWPEKLQKTFPRIDDAQKQVIEAAKERPTSAEPEAPRNEAPAKADDPSTGQGGEASPSEPPKSATPAEGSVPESPIPSSFASQPPFGQRSEAAR
jgi:HlyD family secretion protein